MKILRVKQKDGSIVNIPIGGVDGVSPTVDIDDIENGHRVNITDVNETKSFDVLNGRDGVGVKSIVQKVTSNNDVDPNVIEVTLTDDTNHRFEFKNGSKGSKGDKGDTGDKGDKGEDGYTPIKGVDYFTEAEVEEIKSEVVEEANNHTDTIYKDIDTALDSILTMQDDLIGGGVAGYIDSNNNIILTGNLADGTYTFKYKNEDGTYTDIGSLVVEESSEPETPTPPAYANLADPTSADWLTDSRFGSDGGVRTGATGAVCTNYISVKAGDVLRVKGLDVTNVTTKTYTSVYFEDKTYKTVLLMTSATDGWTENLTVTSTDLQFTFLNETAESYLIRFSGFINTTAEDVIITVNEEIV